MTKVQIAAAVFATLLAASPARADDDSLKISGESLAMAYSLPSKLADIPLDIPVRPTSDEVQEPKTHVKKAPTPSLLTLVAEKVIETVAQVVSKPIAGDSFSLSR